MIHRSACTPSRLYEALRASWSIETGGKWLASNPARGQCSVTALVVHDILGGEILKTDVDGCWHFYNQIGARHWDLTMSQFETPIEYDNLPSTREEALSDTSPEQYRLLRQRVFEWQKRSESRVAHVRLEPSSTNCLLISTPYGRRPAPKVVRFSIGSRPIGLPGSYVLIGTVTSVRLKREQIQLVALDAIVGFVFASGNRLTERHFFEERH